MTYFGWPGVPRTHTPCRTIFYSTLAKLLFMDEQPLRFRAFVAPLTTVRARVMTVQVA